MKGHFVILANMNTKTREGWLGPGAWYKPHYRLQKVSWNFYGLWIWSFNVSGKVMVEIASVSWPVLWISQCCQFLWKGFNSLASHFGVGEECSSVRSNYSAILHLLPCLFQPNIRNKQSLVISADYTVTKNFCTVPCFHGSKSVLRWHSLHKGDVFLLEMSSGGAQPGPVLALVQVVFAGLSWWPAPDWWGGEEGEGGMGIPVPCGRHVSVFTLLSKTGVVMPL